MSTLFPDEVPPIEAYFWLRDIHRYPHTVEFSRHQELGDSKSWGKFLDTNFITEAGEHIGDKPEVRAMAQVWSAANGFHGTIHGTKMQLEHSCNVIAAVDGVARHDTEIDDEHWSIINNMQSQGLESNVIRRLTDQMQHLLGHLSRTAEMHRGVFRQSHKDAIEGRMDRFIHEGAAMVDSFKEMRKDFALPRKPYQIRQHTLSQLVISLDDALNTITPLRKWIRTEPLPEEIRRRIFDNETVFLKARSQVKKWRDNPSQKFGSKLKDLAIEVLEATDELAKLKDESYHAISKMGACFLDRGGRCKNPYT